MFTRHLKRNCLSIALFVFSRETNVRVDNTLPKTNLSEMNAKYGKPLNLIFISLLSGLTAMASVHTKIAGAAWLCVVLGGVYTLCTRKWFQLGDSSQVALPRDPVASAATMWLLFTSLALALKAVAVFYWNSGWEERHAEIRLFLGALGSLGLAIYAVYGRPQVLLVLGLCSACLAAFVLMFLYGEEGAPTNRIPWTSGVSFLIIASLGAAYTVGKLHRVILVLSSGLATFGVIGFSSTRGAYPVGAIWIIALVSMHITSRRNIATAGLIAWKTKAKLLLVIGLFTLSTLILWSSQDFFKGTRARTETAITELSAYMLGDDNSINTSVGARLHMWSLSVPVIVNNLPWGIGKDGRAAQIHRWGVELNSPVIKSLGHLHNEYLQTLLENGLWGLASFLSYTVGMLFAARRLWKSKLKVSSKGLVAIAAMHSLAELTNMNFAHNYYPTLLSLSVAITLLFAQVEAQKQGILARKI
jgi:O-antigen ligase